jgi:predicted ATP-dependent serine protease
LGELALIGRPAETEIIDRLLGDACSGRSGVLVLTGEAGVGKSALLAYARARADGMGVLQTAGVQSEAEIEFAALCAVGSRYAFRGVPVPPHRRTESFAG